MNVGIDLRPLQEYSKFRGIGTVTFELTKALLKNFPGNNYYFYFSDDSDIPEDLSEILKKGKVVKVENIDRSAVFGNSNRKIFIKEDLDVLLYSDPGKTLFEGDFKKIVIFYDIITLLFTEKYLSSRSESLLITLIKYLKYIRFKLAQPKIREKFEDALSADKILAISEVTKKDIVDYFKVQPEKIAVMHLSPAVFFKKLDPKDLENIKAKYSIAGEFIFYVGGLDHRKNILNLIRAIKLINDQSFPQLVISGRDVSRKLMPEAMEIRRFIKQNNLGQKVKLLDYVDNVDVVKLYNAAEFFVFPSIYEGFGLGVLEAMACETAVASSDIATIREIAKDSVLYFDPNNPEDIAQKLKTLNADERLRKELVSRGNICQKSFSWTKAAEIAQRNFSS